MSGGRSATGSGDGGPLEIAVPSDPLAGHPATAYFWGHVAGSGDVTDSGIEVVTNDERAARVLAAIAGGDIARESATREYAHDTSITRTEDEYTLSIGGEADSGDGRGSKLLGRASPRSLPVDGRGTYRFGGFVEYDRELLRGLLEGCGAVCFESSSGTVGISFVHDDRELLELVQDLVADCPVDAPVDDLSEASSGRSWFGVDDEAAPAFGTWCYDNCEETGLFAPSRRRKLENSLERASAYGGQDRRDR